MTSKKLDIQSSVTPNIEAPHIAPNIKDAAKKRLEELMKEEMRNVRGMFQNFETPGGSLRLQVRKYKGHMFDKTMQDGEVYDIPLYVARHLNGVDVTAGDMAEKNPNIGTCSYPKHGFIMPNRGAEPNYAGLGDIPGMASGIPVPIVGIVKRIKRFGFQSTEFAAPHAGAA